ncbi:MAG: hypothetical protein JO358_15355 [Alphaproteobacteria bacterium]|nr:hypothetical protein [Alphaproteobacteria bacterium]
MLFAGRKDWYADRARVLPQEISMIPLVSRVTPAPASDRRPLTGAVVLWLGMLILAFACIAISARNLPWTEEWMMVPPLTGHEPDLLKWLWEQFNEHRIPLAKGIYLILLKASGGDFRIGMITNALILGGLSLALIFAARDLRGHTRLADAFFPIVLVHPGYMLFFLFGFVIEFTIYTALVIGWLLIIVREPWPLSTSNTIISGIILVLLPMAGAQGVLFTPFVALWLAGGAFLFQHDTARKWIFPFQCACVTISLMTTGLYFVGYHSPSWEPAHAGVASTVVTGFRFVGMSLGRVGAGTGRVFPESIIGVAFCGIATLLWLSSLIPLWQGLRRIRRPEGSRFFGFLIFGAATAALVLALAYGRAGWVPLYGMPDSYIAMSVPGLCAAYFAWLLYGPAITRNRIANAFAIAGLLALPFNVYHGLAMRVAHEDRMRVLEQDLAEGLSWREIADGHWQILFPWDRNTLIEYAGMLHDAKIGPFGRAPP